MLNALKQLIRNHPWVQQQRALSQARRIMNRWIDHDEEMLRFYRSFVKPGDLVFDVGANLGNRVHVFRRIGAKVVAVEPQRDCLYALRKLYNRDAAVEIEPCALGKEPGESVMFISTANTVSSMSVEWIKAVNASQRFAGFSWNQQQRVQVKTLDQLIEQHGCPVFIKIDVEGFEEEVLEGLQAPVNVLSIEFTPEYLDSTFRCVEHMSKLGQIEVNYSLGESMELACRNWMTPAELQTELKRFVGDAHTMGDVYIRFFPAKTG
jgi:FkbM family methyltransferase